MPTTEFQTADLSFFIGSNEVVAVSILIGVCIRYVNILKYLLSRTYTTTTWQCSILSKKIGMLLHVGEHILVQTNDEHAIKVLQFFCHMLP